MLSRCSYNDWDFSNVKVNYNMQNHHIKKKVNFEVIKSPGESYQTEEVSVTVQDLKNTERSTFYYTSFRAT